MHLQPLTQEFISVGDELLKADVPRAILKLCADGRGDD